jgi:hypothetical protein
MTANVRFVSCLHTFKKEPAIHSRTAFSRSASWSIIALFLPPSSIRHGLRFCPQTRAICLPTLALPVKLIFFTAGCSIIIFATSGASAGRQDKILRTPAGSPASWKALPMAQKQRGVNSEALRIVVLPVAIAVAAERIPKT